MKSAAINSVFCCTSWWRPEEESQEKALAVAVSTNFGRGHMCTCQRPRAALTDSTSCLLTNLTLEVEVMLVELQAELPAADPSTCVSVTIMWSDGGFIPSPASLWWLKHDVVIELTCLCLIQPEQQINVDDEPAASLSQWPLIQSLLYTRASCERLLLYCFTTLLPSKSHL